jgi:peptidoglycan/LPS O-acetylase OafA/YrhL
VPLSAGFFRLILAAAVVVHHMSRFHLGSVAVYVFFVLSGYWVVQMWKSKYRWTAQPYRTFMISRAWRILPVFWLMNALSIVATIYTTGQADFPLHAIISSVTPLGYASLSGPGTYMTPAWSLDIEMQFYFIAPLLLSPALISDRGRKWLLWGLGAASTIYLIYFLSADHRAKVATALGYLGFFTLGMVHAVENIRPSTRAAALSALGFVAMVLAILATPELRTLIIQKQRGPLTDYDELTAIALAFALAPYAMWTVRRAPHRFDKKMGDWSYILYLFHWPVVIVYGYFCAEMPLPEKLVFAGVALAVMALGTAVIWRYVDRPIDALRNKYVHDLRKIGTRSTGRHGP